MRIELNKEELANTTGHTGLEISVKGFQGDAGAIPTQVYIEYYEGKLAIHVWDGSSQDCHTHIIRPEVSE